MLSIANIQSDKYQSLLQKTAGIIFIGGPHDLANTQELKEKVLDISRCFAKKSLSKEAAANIREEVVELRDISSRYTNINLRVDTLSVFETVGTTLRYGRLGITKQKRTVGVISVQLWLAAFQSHDMRSFLLNKSDRGSSPRYLIYISRAVRWTTSFTSRPL